MNIYVRSVGCLLCQSWCWWCQGFTKWLVMCFSSLCVLEWFKSFGIIYIYALRGHWIHLWNSQAHNEPFGGGQWEPLGLDSVEAEPETRIHVKQSFWGSAPRRSEEGCGKDLKQGCGLSWPGASAWSSGEAWGKNSITEGAFLRLDVQCEFLSHVWLFVRRSVHPRLLCPWNSLGKNAGVGGHLLEIYPLGISSWCRDQTWVSCTAGRFFTRETDSLQWMVSDSWSLKI